MAYEVTATRRRPKTFDELAGQDFVVATLKNSIETGRIAHAYLFSGPRGCGKTSAARILARSLNCEKGPTATPCGVCSNCVEISRGASMDIIEIDGASNTGVNDVRQIKDEVLFPPNSGRYKVYIIDEVHMLSNSAFNALLKTIEEPPPYIIFIFATTELHKVPATIKSRCQQFNFRLIPLDTIQGILKNTCGEMQIEAEDEALFWIAKESTGSLRDAYTIFDQVASFSDGFIRAALIQEKLGLVGLDTLNTLAEACAAGDNSQAFAIIDGRLDAGVAVEQFVIDMAGYYRSLLLLKNGVTRESVLGYNPERFSASVLQALDSIHLERALSILLDLYRDVRYSVSPRFELETAVAKLCWLTQWVSPQELRAAVAGAREVLGGNREDPAGKGGIARPLAGPGRIPAPAETTLDRHGSGDNPGADQRGAFSEGFKQYMAARESAGAGASPEEGDPFFGDPPGTGKPPSGEPPTEAKDPSTEAREPPVEAGEPPPPPEAVFEGDEAARLKAALISGFKLNRGVLASGLERSLPWEWSGDKLIIPVRDSLGVELLKKDAALIQEALVRIRGRPLPFEVVVGNHPGEALPEESPAVSPQVELVCRVFRGTVVKKDGSLP
ncbi:DNA polymerase III subunit gamma/tau [Treponema sp. TIM-1]|uniref:DNA polymerase III subunit gamma/tau n=1 Tax=Treponema sp. TIM-1 TaxID=2898417 RepID=UPI00398048AD